MGFRDNAYATFWGEPRRISDTLTLGRISISRKKPDGEYEQQFGSSVSFNGTAAASKALTLKERDRIKLLKCDVDDDKVIDLGDGKKIKSFFFKIWDFENADNPSDGGQRSSTPQASPVASRPAPDVLVENDDDLPF